MERVHFAAGAIAVLLLAGEACADVNYWTNGDLFDIGRGAIISAHSPIANGGGEALLSNDTAGIEPGSLFFTDGSDGTVHFIEFQTAQPVEVAGVNLWCGADYPDLPERRTIERFRLRARVGDAWQTIYDSAVETPYEFIEDFFLLIVSTPVTRVVASEFRAEFTQHGSGIDHGPRIIELDAFPPKVCGDANYDGSVSASDALGALRSAVMLEQCPHCVCNVVPGSGVAASDALQILRSAVGQNAPLICFTCYVGHTE